MSNTKKLEEAHRLLAAILNDVKGKNSLIAAGETHGDPDLDGREDDYANAEKWLCEVLEKIDELEVVL